MKAPSGQVTHAWFPPGTVLDNHRHAGSILAVMLDGSFSTTLGRRQIECTPSTAWTEPAEELHANRVGTGGAQVLVVQVSQERGGLLGPLREFLANHVALRNSLIVADARRLAREIRIGDSLAPVAVDSLVLTMLTSACRSASEAPTPGPTPPWLLRARDLIHTEFRRGLGLGEIAANVDVCPSHLAHEFRRRFRCTIGEYARRLRLDWAVERLLSSDEPISHVALSAGFCDQAHLTRTCTRELGMSPASLRARSSRGARVRSACPPWPRA